jgi:2-phosphosulfolactate phosphatase
MALAKGANEIVTGSFANIDAVCDYLINSGKPVLLACAAWKDRINIEDTLFAGAVINKTKNHFDINCDGSKIAQNLYNSASGDLYGFMKEKQATHFLRLTNFGLEKDIKHCLTDNTAPVLPLYQQGKLLKANNNN